MLLNKVIREAVVSRIMADIPQHDYLTWVSVPLQLASPTIEGEINV